TGNLSKPPALILRPNKGFYRVNANSLATYMKKQNADADTKVRTAIDNAIKEVSSMPAPFRNHLTAAETQKAVEACNELMNALDNAITEISK
ncbi:MAG: imelysin family protein, partial [Sodaliphilus sp.]|nr:imelysin family protein [Sodaliphilus sp.]